MLTILDQSVSSKRIRNFRSFTWGSSNNLPDTLTKTFWGIRTNIHKFRFIQYLQMKNLVGVISYTEYRCLLDAPGVLKDDLFIDALRAWKTDVPKNILWQRLATLQRLLRRPQWTLNLYYTYNGNVTYEIVEARSPIRKVKKYSGYVRNSSQVGSKRRLTSPKPEPERFEWNTNGEIDYYQFLTVGELDSGLPGGSTFTLTSPKLGRNGKPI